MSASTAVMNGQSAPAAYDPWAMTATAKTSGGDYEVCPKGNLSARIVGVIDTGYHTDTYKGKTSDARKLILIIETAKKGKDGNPFLFAKEYFWTFNKGSQFRSVVESVTGKSFQDGEHFSPPSLAGLPVFAMIIHDVKVKYDEKAKEDKTVTYANLQGISQYPEEIPEPGLTVNPVTVWTIFSGQPFPDDSWMPRYYGKIIKETADAGKTNRAIPVTGSTTTQVTEDDNGDNGDDIPF